MRLRIAVNWLFAGCSCIVRDDVDKFVGVEV